MEQEISRLEGVVRSIEAKLANEKFISNAPQKVIEAERQKLDTVNSNLLKLRDNFKRL